MTGWLADTLISTSVLMLLVLVVREPVRRMFGATAAYALWLLPAARMAMPPITRTIERIVPAAAPVEPATITASIAPIAPIADPSLLEALGGWPTLLITAWALGALVFLTLGLIRYRRQRRFALDGAVQLARIGSIRLVRSHAVRGPIAFGILDRVIAVPEDFDRRFDEAQRRLALDHELSHHRSGDLVANHIAFVLLGLQWFNPLAWLSHAAFRFDQEAACDCRVLDKVGPHDRANYGRTIAKAASGRVLLFASALDHQHNLHRRLKSMLDSPTPKRRLAGKLIIVSALAVALPLTATWATRYVDAPAPSAPPTAMLAPLAPLAPTAPLASASLVAPIAPTPPVPPMPAVRVVPSSNASQPDISFIGEGQVRINGTTKRWEQLTAAERAQIRRETAKARSELDRQVARLPQELANAQKEADRFRSGDFKREMVDARASMRQALAELDAQAAVIRASGQDPEKLKADVRASLREVEAMDIDKMVREALASVNPNKMAADLREAQASLARVEARLDGLDRN